MHKCNKLVNIRFQIPPVAYTIPKVFGIYFLQNIPDLLHPGSRPLVTPVREPDEDFIAAWQHLPYTGKPFEINAPEFFTCTGVRVRSKSEVIIADALNRAGIPFRYEFPASIKGWGINLEEVRELIQRKNVE